MDSADKLLADLDDLLLEIDKAKLSDGGRNSLVSRTRTLRHDVEEVHRVFEIEQRLESSRRESIDFLDRHPPRAYNGKYE